MLRNLREINRALGQTFESQAGQTAALQQLGQKLQDMNRKQEELRRQREERKQAARAAAEAEGADKRKGPKEFRIATPSPKIAARVRSAPRAASPAPTIAYPKERSRSRASSPAPTIAYPEEPRGRRSTRDTAEFKEALRRTADRLLTRTRYRKTQSVPPEHTPLLPIAEDRPHSLEPPKKKQKEESYEELASAAKGISPVKGPPAEMPPTEARSRSRGPRALSTSPV